MRSRKKAGKINIPDKSLEPRQQTKNNDLSSDLATKEVIAELQILKNEFLEKTNQEGDLTPKQKLKLATDLIIKKTKENMIIKEHMKNAREEYLKKRGTQPVNKRQTSVDKARKQIRKIEVAYIELYKDAESKVYNWIPLYKVPPIIINHKKRLLFLLDEPAKYLNGKAVYILIEQIPFCIPMNFYIDDLHENMEKMPNLEKDKQGIAIYGRAHLSPIDLYAKFLSIKFQMLFGLRRSLALKIFEYAVSFLMGMATLYIILSPYLFASG